MISAFKPLKGGSRINTSPDDTDEVINETPNRLQDMVKRT